MSLPAPHLDDRSFQDLVDEAKRLVQQRCPEWTDHNVSDPGVTLIEAFAQMVDQLIYRLNRVPERHYVKFLEMLGVELRPPAAARGAVTFWLSAPQPQPVVVRAETEVATPRTDVTDPVVFATVDQLDIVPCAVARVATRTSAGDIRDRTGELTAGREFGCFAAPPTPGDALLIGLTAAVPSCAVVLRLQCRIRGVGVRPDWPPLAWEAWTGDGWTPCEIDRDETGGINRPGDVVLHVPAGHEASVLAGHRAGWLRCRLVPAAEGQPAYVESPTIRAMSGFTIGGTARTLHAQAVRGEEIGVSDGTPGQRFALQRRPVVPWERPTVLQVLDSSGVTEWTAVEHFGDCGPDDRVFHLDPFAGEIQLGPAVREPDGTLRHYGAVPTQGSHLRVSVYRTGGGPGGNVAPGAVRVLKTSVPYVARVENRSPAVGGAAAESIEDATVRGPLLLRSRGRAVTADDFVQLTRQVAPEIARVQCLPLAPGRASDGGAGAVDGAGAPGVRLVVVPGVVRDELGRIRRADLDPLPEWLDRISTHLDERRLIGTRLVIGPPEYLPLTVVASLRARPRYRPDDVRREVVTALHDLFDPLTGGPEGTGWPLGRAVQVQEVTAALSRVPGVDMAEEVVVQLFPAGPDGRRGEPVTRFTLPPTGLVHSFEHQVRVR